MEIDKATSDSILSINGIGEELGREFEIVVSHRRAAPDSQDALRRLRKSCPNLVFLESGIETFGQGKKIAFDYSSGKFIVPFNTRIKYPIQYADILHSFLKFKLKRLFFSELPLVSREVVSEVGGWRNLSSGEDIDLYSRISINYGVFACPTSILGGDDNSLREMLSIRKLSYRNMSGIREAYHYIRDLIISCNHSFSDVRNIARILKEVEGTSRPGLFLLSYIGSRFSKIKPVSYTRNNYIILMESILESLILREYTRLQGVSEDVSWHIDRAHIRFLIKRSKLFREMKHSTALFLKDQI